MPIQVGYVPCIPTTDAEKITINSRFSLQYDYGRQHDAQRNDIMALPK